MRAQATRVVDGKVILTPDVLEAGLLVPDINVRRAMVHRYADDGRVIARLMGLRARRGRAARLGALTYPSFWRTREITRISLRTVDRLPTHIAPHTRGRVYHDRATCAPPDQAEKVGGRSKWSNTFKGTTLTKFIEGLNPRHPPLPQRPPPAACVAQANALRHGCVVALALRGRRGRYSVPTTLTVVMNLFGGLLDTTESGKKFGTFDESTARPRACVPRVGCA